MTNKEAIEYAKSIAFCNGCPVDMSVEGNSAACNECKDRLFFEKAINALDTKIKKKPIYREFVLIQGLPADKLLTCPMCGSFFDKHRIGEHYCKMCGQAIDWRDKE